MDCANKCYPRGVKTSDLPTIDYRTVTPLQGDLKDLSEKNFEKLKRVLEKRGFDIPLFIWKHDGENYILDGHQRVRVAEKIGLEPVEVPYIEITAKNEKEAKKRVLEISSQYGTITQEGYDEFTADLPEAELLDTVHFDTLSYLRNDEEVEEQDSPYTKKVTPPVYEVKGEKPSLSDLFDTTKTDELLKEIEASSIPDEVKEFLRVAAHRHTIFRYDLIAEFYSHASEEEQDLFEKSALVIIDFDKAIENGFTRLSEEIAGQYGKDT